MKESRTLELISEDMRGSLEIVSAFADFGKTTSSPWLCSGAPTSGRRCRAGRHGPLPTRTHEASNFFKPSFSALVSRL